MKRHLARLSALAAVIFALESSAADPVADSAFPPDSILRSPIALEDQSGHTFALDALRGHPVLIAMFYGTCRTMCPQILGTLANIESRLGQGERARLRIVLVTLDPEHDDRAALQALAASHHFDPARWTVARTTPEDLRHLAALLDVRYRRLPNGEINHSSKVQLLDRDGRIVARTERVSGFDAEFFERVSAMLGTGTR